MAEPVAEHERSDLQPLRVCGQPGGRHHRFEHRLVVGQRRHEVIHACDPDESRRFSGVCPCDQVVEREPHLGKKQVDSTGPQN